MLYDLSFLEKGKPWPPPAELERLDDYKYYRDLFHGEHAKVYTRQFRRIERVVGNFNDILSYPIILNYHRLVSLKTADLIFSEPPKITLPDDRTQKVLDDIIKATDLFNTCHKAAVDASRYGDAVLSKAQVDGSPVIVASSPDYWFPVIDRSDISKRLYDVQAWGYQLDGNGKPHRLKVILYSDKNVETVEYELIGGSGSGSAYRMGAEIPGTRSMMQTDEAKSLLVTAHNVLTTDRVYGTSDYEAFDSVLSEIMVRVAQVSKVLDAHSNPSMSGPQTAIEEDESGNGYFRAGNYFSRSSTGDPPLEYIVWDASLTANFEQIKQLLHHLYTLSEMGSVLLGDFSATTGAVPSGTALRRLLMSPIAKVARIRNSFDRALKKLLASCLSDKGVNVNPEDVSIVWNDGLPQDPTEMTNIISTRTGGMPTLSVWSAIQRLDGLSAKDTETEMEMIKQDEEGPAPPQSVDGEL